MKYYSASLLIVCSLLLFSCKSTKYTPATFEGPQLVFGSGGGFTGAVTTYCLLENGQLFTKNGVPGKNETDYESVKKVSKKVAKSLFAQANASGLLNAKKSQPGNMYCFVKMLSGDTTGSVAWDQAKPLDDPVVQLYDQLMKTVKN